MKALRLRRLTLVALLLWLLHGGLLIALAVVPELELGARVVDLAHGKDVVWMALATAIAAIGYSTWLVKEMRKQHEADLAALNKLANEFAHRPCWYLEFLRGNPTPLTQKPEPPHAHPD